MTGLRTYLDYNATAPLRPEARAAMSSALDLVGNASSVHAEGRGARATIEAARAEVAKLAGASGTADVVFTSGGSEAVTAVLRNGHDAVVVAGIEHAAVRDAASASGARVIGLATGSDGIVAVDALDRALDEANAATGRVLVCLQAANNETGIVQPVALLARRAKERGADVFSDMVQAAGRLAIDISTLGVDALAISAHKLGGPMGAGAIVVAPGYRLRALVNGGGQERGRRGGTENVAAIAGFGAACAAALRDLAGEQTRLTRLRDRLEDELAAATPGVVVIGQATERLCNTSLIALPGSVAETSVIALDLTGVAASAGAACSSGKSSRSPVLAAMGVSDDIAKSAVRFSLGWASDDNDVTQAVAAWRQVNTIRSGARQVA